MPLATLYSEPSERREPLSQPLVSLVIVCYNQARYLQEAIESVHAQTYFPLEVILVDDGSTDDTPAIARTHSNIRYIRQSNKGLAAARNTGIRHCSGEFVAFLDADDKLLPHAIQAGVGCFQRSPECGLVFGSYRNIRGDGSPVPAETPPAVDREYYWNLLQGNSIGMHATVLYRWNVLNAVGGFHEGLAACEDYELYLRIARTYSVNRHVEVVAEYRQHDSNMSKDRAFMLRSVLRVLKMQRSWLPDHRHRRAMRQGLRVWRDYYGAMLLQEWKQNPRFSKLLQIVRLDPQGVLQRALRAAGTKMLEGPLKRRRSPASIEFGSLRRIEPYSRKFGFDRGQPIDRYYIESFLAANCAVIRGRVAEVGDDTYSRAFGGGRITHQDVIHVMPGQPGVTITADLACAPHIPNNSFDCIILTQTLHYIFNLRSAVATLHRVLKPGGVVLATLPGISQICRDQFDRASDCWRFTDSSARRLFEEFFGEQQVRVETRGNVLAATAFLQGLCVGDLSTSELDRCDPDYQLTITVAATKLKENECSCAPEA